MAKRTIVAPRARAFMDQALANTKTGVSLEIGTHGQAVNFRQACHTVRSQERKANRSYEPGHPLYNKSPYDDLFFEIEQRGKELVSSWWVVAMSYGNVVLDIKTADGEDLC